MKFDQFNISIVFIVNLFFLSITYSKQKEYKNVCKNPNYPDTTLNILSEQAIADSFTDDFKSNEDTNIPQHFEGSDVVLRSDGQVMYVVFDNSFQIGAFCTSPTNCIDEILDWPDKSVRHLASQFEGITYNSLHDTYFIAQEAISTIDDKKKFQPNIFEIRIGQNNSLTNIQIIESCRVEMEYESENKGFEGLEFVVHEKTGKSYLFGLCEANKCASRISEKTIEDDIGHGRIVVLEKKERTKKHPCVWKLVDKIHLPSSIPFIDYSAVSIYRRNSPMFPTYIAITGQENSQVWIGHIDEIKKSPFFEISTLKKDISYNLPRANDKDNECSIQYCNIEGVAWRNKRELILVSDKSKKDQDDICNGKDQSIHYVKLPKKLD